MMASSPPSSETQPDFQSGSRDDRTAHTSTLGTVPRTLPEAGQTAAGASNEQGYNRLGVAGPQPSSAPSDQDPGMSSETGIERPHTHPRAPSESQITFPAALTVSNAIENDNAVSSFTTSETDAADVVQAAINAPLRQSGSRTASSRVYTESLPHHIVLGLVMATQSIMARDSLVQDPGSLPESTLRTVRQACESHAFRIAEEQSSFGVSLQRTIDTFSWETLEEVAEAAMQDVVASWNSSTQSPAITTQEQTVVGAAQPQGRQTHFVDQLRNLAPNSRPARQNRFEEQNTQLQTGSPRSQAVSSSEPRLARNWRDLSSSPGSGYDADHPPAPQQHQQRRNAIAMRGGTRPATANGRSAAVRTADVVNLQTITTRNLERQELVRPWRNAAIPCNDADMSDAARHGVALCT